MDLSTKEVEFLTHGKIFYKGVIEDNNDPLQMGRVRVRLLGIHSINTTDVPVNTLPWANVLQPLSFGGFNSGIGISSVPIQGTWVWCFVDFEDINNITVLGAISGINSEKLSNQGFIDPDGVYPLEAKLGQSDFNSRAKTNYTQVYTIETPSGHIVEIDDSTGYILIKHASKGYVTLTGNNISCVFDDKHIILSSSGVDIVGDVTITGKVTASDIIKSDIDVLASSISLKSHLHVGVTPGMSVTGLPQ